MGYHLLLRCLGHATVEIPAATANVMMQVHWIFVPVLRCFKPHRYTTFLKLHNASNPIQENSYRAGSSLHFNASGAGASSKWLDALIAPRDHPHDGGTSGVGAALIASEFVLR